MSKKFGKPQGLWLLSAGAGLILAMVVIIPRLMTAELTPIPTDAGREARRVVLFEGYELAAALGGWERIAGITRYAYDNDLLQRLVPHPQQIPSPGTGFDVNVEALLALQPDLVVTWSRKPETVEFLRSQGVPVLTINPEGLADLRRDLLRLGRVLGREDRARQVAALMEESLSQLRRRVAAIPAGTPPRMVWLWGKPTTVSGNQGVVPELIQLAGGGIWGRTLIASTGNSPWRLCWRSTRRWC
jgi:iron complex transport system substrate-binding protein